MGSGPVQSLVRTHLQIIDAYDDTLIVFLSDNGPAG